MKITTLLASALALALLAAPAAHAKSNGRNNNPAKELAHLQNELARAEAHLALDQSRLDRQATLDQTSKKTQRLTEKAQAGVDKYTGFIADLQAQIDALIP